jgi:hypothetical protein
VVVPSRKELAGKYLDYWVQRCEDAVHKELTTNKKMICLGHDAWTDLNQHPVMNFIGMRKDFNVILHCHTGEESHDANLLVSETSKIIDRYPTSIVGCVTDNTAVNRCMWRQLKDKYPGKFFYGCAAHLYHLLVKDLFKWPKRNSANFPMRKYAQLASTCSSIINLLSRGHVRCRIRQQQIDANLKTLKMYGETRWGSLFRMFESIESNLHAVLYPQFDDESWKAAEKDEFRALLHDDEWKKDLKAAIHLLRCIDENLNYCQSDSLLVSDVYKQLSELKTKLRHPRFTQEESDWIMKRIDARWDFICSDCHRIGYYLDPRYAGKMMSREEKSDVRILIKNYNIGLDLPPMVMQAHLENELNSYLTYVLSNKEEIKLQSQSPTFSSLTWWLDGESEYPYLYLLAQRVFSLVVSTSSVERSFKTRGNIHTIIRNRLKVETTTKLVQVKLNSHLLSLANITKKRKLPQSPTSTQSSDAGSNPNQSDILEEWDATESLSPFFPEEGTNCSWRDDAEDSENEVWT